MRNLLLLVSVVVLVGCIPPVESNVPGGGKSLNTSKLADGKPGASQSNTNDELQDELKSTKEALQKAKKKEQELNEQIKEQSDELKALNSVISSSKDKIKSVLESLDSIGKEPTPSDAGPSKADEK